VKWGTDLGSYAKNAVQSATTLVAGSELEKKLAEATSNEPWGASGTLSTEIARSTYGYDDFKVVMATIWRNTQLTPALWRVVYKTLNLLDYLLRHGSERVIEDARDHVRDIKKMHKFEYTDADGKDCGLNVREKARQLVEILGNEEQLSAERDKARANKNKFTGTSADDLGFGNTPQQNEGKSNPSRKGFSDDDFKFSAERGRASSGSGAGLTTMLGSMYSTATEYAAAANKQLASMQTLFPSNELDRKLGEATSNEPGMPSSGLLYELGKATHRDDDYRIILSAIWQTVLRSNQRPRVVLKTLLLLESVLLHGPDRALEESIDMKTDIKALVSFSCSDFNEAGKVQSKAQDVIDLLEDGSKLQNKRNAAAESFGNKYRGFSSSDYSEYKAKTEKADQPEPKGDSFGNFEGSFGEDASFGTAFDTLKEGPAPAPAASADMFSFDSPGAASAAPDPVDAGASQLTGSIGKISIPGREGSRARSGGAGGSAVVTLAKLPTPAACAPPGVPAPSLNAGDDLLGLMGGMDMSASAPTVSDFRADPFGAASATTAAVAFGAAPIGTVPPPMGASSAASAGVGDADAFAISMALNHADDLGAADGRAVEPPPKSAMDTLLEASSFSMDAPAPALKSSEPAKKSLAPMGPGSGLGMLGPLPPPAPAPMGGISAGQGLPPMGAPMRTMGGMSSAGCVDGGVGMGGVCPMGVGGMGGGMGGGMRGMASSMPSTAGMGAMGGPGNGLIPPGAGVPPIQGAAMGMPLMGGGGPSGAAGPAPAPAPAAPDPFASLMK